jgi:hypothetical protein
MAEKWKWASPPWMEAKMRRSRYMVHPSLSQLFRVKNASVQHTTADILPRLVGEEAETYKCSQLQLVTRLPLQL